MNKKTKKTEYRTNRLCVQLLVLATLGIVLFTPTQNVTVGRVVLGEATNHTNLQETPDQIKVNVTLEQALAALRDAELIMDEMKQLNIATFRFNDTLLQAKRSFVGTEGTYIQSLIAKEEGNSTRNYLLGLAEIFQATPGHERTPQNLMEVAALTKGMLASKQNVYRLLDSIEITKETIPSYKAKNVNTTKGIMKLAEAETAVREERFEEAALAIEKAKQLLDEASIEQKRIKSLASLSKNFIEKNWLIILITITGIAIGIKPVFKNIRKKRAMRKIAAYKHEFLSLKEMMKKNQENYFTAKTISKETFTQRQDQFRKKYAEIKHTLPIYEHIAGIHRKEKKDTRGSLVVTR